MLRVENLSVSYGGIKAVTDASLTAGAGEVTCIIGRNGSGKSSLVNAVAGLVKTSSGRVILGDVDVSSISPWRRARAGISLVPEDRRIFASLSVRENLILAAKSARGSDASVDRVLTIFPELSNLLARAGNEISGGQQQMVAIGRGLMREPELLILDEPSLGLAPIVVAQVFEAIRSIASAGQSVLLIEQNARAALEVSARGYAMSLGTLRPLSDDARSLDPDELAELYL